MSAPRGRKKDDLLRLNVRLAASVYPGLVAELMQVPIGLKRIARLLALADKGLFVERHPFPISLNTSGVTEPSTNRTSTRLSDEHVRALLGEDDDA